MRLLRCICGRLQPLVNQNLVLVRSSFDLKPCSQASLQISQRRTILDARDKDHEEKDKQLIVRSEHLFDEAAKKARNKVTFQKAVNKYLERGEIYRRNHVEFIYASLNRMKDFGVERDLTVYKQIMELFPKKKMVPRSFWQVEMMHYPKQQQCCIDLLDQMEDYAVIPDDNMGYLMRDIFGDKSHAFRKYQRMMYWLPKFKHANPYPIPQVLPDDIKELARIALKRMAVDVLNELSDFESTQAEGALDDTFIVSAQAPHQQELIEVHPIDKALYVEGPFIVWLREKSLSYFILRADVTDAYNKYQEEEPKKEETLFDWVPFMESENLEKTAVLVPPSCHEQSDGTILAMCITGTSTKDSLMSWIKLLQTNNPKLSTIPVLFMLRSMPQGIEVVQEDKLNNAEVIKT